VRARSPTSQGPGTDMSWDHGTVKRSSAVGHLVEMGAVASERLSLHQTDSGWPLEEL